MLNTVTVALFASTPGAITVLWSCSNRASHSLFYTILFFDDTASHKTNILFFTVYLQYISPRNICVNLRALNFYAFIKPALL